MERSTSRLLLQLEPQRRAINRETINPEIREMGMEEVRLILTMTAEVRAAYINSLVDLAHNRDGMPNADQIAELNTLRDSFNTLVDATNAMEAAIERGYIDVRDSKAA